MWDWAVPVVKCFGADGDEPKRRGVTEASQKRLADASSSSTERKSSFDAAANGNAPSRQQHSSVKQAATAWESQDHADPPVPADPRASAAVRRGNG